MEAVSTGRVFDVTPAAVEHILAMMRREGCEGAGLRVAVVPGGCSGFEYSLNFAPEPEPGDTVVDVEALKIFVDQTSLAKLAGTTLDYFGGLYGAGLKFTNPNAANTCGCGTSFSIQ